MRTAASALVEVPSPVRIVTLDLESTEAAPGLAASRRPAGGLWVLVTRGGEPVGTVLLGHDEQPSEAEVRALCAARFARAAHPVPPELGEGPAPLASVVIPTNLQRPEGLRRTVAAVLASDYPRFELVIVDNRTGGASGAVDAVVEQLRADDARVRVVREPRPGIAAARNRGLESAAGEFVAFTDDDAQPEPGWLRALVARFQAEPQVQAITGLVLPRELETPAQVCFERSGVFQERGFRPLTFFVEEEDLKRRFSPRRFTVTRVDHVGGASTRFPLLRTGALGMGCNLAVRRETALVTRFDDALGVGTPTFGGEDIEFQLRVLERGGSVAYEPGARVHHSHRLTADALERQMYGYGVGLTAMLSALVRADPRHLLALAALVPSAALTLVRTGSPKRGADEGYPPALARAERRGMLVGPIAYQRSRRLQARWRSPRASADASSLVADPRPVVVR